MIKRHQFLALLASATLFGTSQASAGLAHEYNFDADGSDSVGTAHLDINGTAFVAGGLLDLPGGGVRTNNASASGTALTELGATINGTDSLTVVIRYNTAEQQNWSKLIMAGSPGAQPARSFIDLTPARGGGQGAGMTIDTTLSGADFGPNGLPIIAAGTDAIHIGVWDETTDTMTVYNAIDGDTGSLNSASLSMGGEDLANIPITEFYLGSAVHFGDFDFSGRIDQVQIYDHALTLGEVTALVPEPGSLALLGAAVFVLSSQRRRRN